MRARLAWEQTPDERYDLDMYQVLTEMMEMWLTIEGSGGGANLTSLVADEEFLVKGKRKHILMVRRLLAASLKREIHLDWVYPWSNLVNSMGWKWKTFFHDKGGRDMSTFESGLGEPLPENDESGEATDNVTQLPAEQPNQNPEDEANASETEADLRKKLAEGNDEGEK